MTGDLASGSPSRCGYAVHRLPAFDTNYLWLLTNGERAAVVDPGDAAPVLAALQRLECDLRDILITHHHADHIGGVDALLQAFPQARVYGPDDERIPQVQEVVRENDALTLESLDATLTVLEVPGHTSSHIAYYGDGKLFCGDTLFACGCGRLFEGTPEQMHASLTKIRNLPETTEVYCAHEYTLDNIEFALWVEPNNEALLTRRADATRMRENGEATVPFNLGLDRQTNPFLRFDAPQVERAAQRFADADLSGEAQVFGAIRRWKDTEFD